MEFLRKAPTTALSPLITAGSLPLAIGVVCRFYALSMSYYFCYYCNNYWFFFFFLFQQLSNAELLRPLPTWPPTPIPDVPLVVREPPFCTTLLSLFPAMMIHDHI